MPAHGTGIRLADLARRFDYAFRPWKPPGFFRPVMVPHPFSFGTTGSWPLAWTIQVFEQDHGVMKTAGLRIGRFGYSTDVVALDDAAFEPCTASTPGWSAASNARRTRRTPMSSA